MLDAGTVSSGSDAGGAHCALQSWHAEWLGRQHHALLAVMRMYCQTITSTHLTPELQAHMLLEGALAAAAERQRLSKAVRESEMGVVLDTSTVEEGAWLGSLMQTSPTSRYAIDTLLFFHCVYVESDTSRIPFLGIFEGQYTALMSLCAISCSQACEFTRIAALFRVFPLTFSVRSSLRSRR